MVKSFDEVKSILNIKTLKVEWNDTIPSADFKKLCADKDIKFYNPYINQIETISKKEIYNQSLSKLEKALSNQSIPVNRRALYQLGVLAENFDLLLTYFVINPTTIEMFFYPKMENIKEWFEMFKSLVTRRQFFNLVKSYKTIKNTDSVFSNSCFYQISSPEQPDYCSNVYFSKLNNDYIVVQYKLDIDKPVYRVIKLGKEFKTLVPEVVYDGSLEGITLTVEGKKFVGDSIKHLWNGVDKVKKNIEIEFNKFYYSLDTDNAILYIDDGEDGKYNEEIQIEKFKKDLYAYIVLDRTINHTRMIVLSNGYVWNVNHDKFFNLAGNPALIGLNTEVFSMSSEEKGVFLCFDGNSVERVPVEDFDKILVEYLHK